MGSTYVQEPPYFEGLTKTPVPVTDIENARILALFLDSIKKGALFYGKRPFITGPPRGKNALPRPLYDTPEREEFWFLARSEERCGHKSP